MGFERALSPLTVQLAQETAEMIVKWVKK